MHPSNVEDNTEIKGYSCGKEKCACHSGVKLHCPLCDVNRLSPLASNKLLSHISAIHWNHKLNHKDAFILCCNLDCDNGGHFHCPICSSIHSRLSRIKQHLESCENEARLEAEMPPEPSGMVKLNSSTESSSEIIVTSATTCVAVQSNKTEAPSCVIVQNSNETEIMHPSETAMHQSKAPSLENKTDAIIDDAVIVTENDGTVTDCTGTVTDADGTVTDAEGTVYIIQDGDVDSSVIEAIKHSRLESFTGVSRNSAEIDPSNFTFQVVNSEDNSGSVVMFINESDLESGAIEKLQSGEFVLQTAEGSNQVVLVAVPENETQKDSNIEGGKNLESIDCYDEDDHTTSLRKQLGQFYHESFIRCLEDLTSMISDVDQNCCPLCEDEDEGQLQFESPDQVHSHLEDLHWKMRIDLVGFSIASCGLPCAIDRSSNEEFHWHCPYCWVTGEFASLKSHVRSHTNMTNVAAVVSEEQINEHRKSVKLKGTIETQKNGPPRKRGRPSNRERTLKFVEDILEEVIDAVVTGTKSWDEKEEREEGEKGDSDGEEKDTEEMDAEEIQGEIVQPQVVPRYGDDGRELVIRTRRQQGIESGLSPRKFKRKFVEVDSDDDIMVGDDDDGTDDDYKAPEIKCQKKEISEESSLEMLLLAAEKTAPSNAENMQLAVSDDGSLLLQSVDQGSGSNKSGRNLNRKYGLSENVTCPSCLRPFRKRHLFYQHLFNSKCLRNERSFPKDILETVQDAIQTVNSRTCPLCSKEFCDMQHTRVHYALKTCQNTFMGKMGYEKNEVTGQYKCHHCDYSSVNPRVLVAHEAREHVDKKDYECQICHRKYAFHVLLQRHLKTTHFAPSLPKCQCEVCGKTMYTKHIKQHMRMAHDPDFSRAKEPELDSPAQCDLCDFRTTFRRKLEKHKRRIHGEKDKECNKCGQSFALRQDLTAHYKVCSVDVEERQDECHHCGKKMLKKNLKKHIELVHQNNRRYECGVCSKKFQTKYVLQCHMDTHLNPSERIPKYLCGTCGKGFVNRTMLRDHINIHTGNTPYICKYCDKQFKCGPTLYRHQELHTGIRYNCKVCGSMFTTKSYWKQHMRKHTEDIAFKCECGKEYQTQSGLRNHRSTCSASMDAEQAVEHLETVETQTIDGATFLWSEEEQQVLQVSSQEMDGETFVVLETIGTDILSTQGNEDEGVSIVQSDDVVMETEEMIEQQVALETSEVSGDNDHFLCGHCQQTFTSMEEVKEHMLSHFDEFADGDEVNLSIQTTNE